MSSAILTANLPTLVPPNFCTSHFAAGSIEFWCKFGGVGGGVVDEVEELEDRLGEDRGEGVREASAIVSLFVGTFVDEGDVMLLQSARVVPKIYCQ